MKRAWMPSLLNDKVLQSDMRRGSDWFAGVGTSFDPAAEDRRKRAVAFCGEQVPRGSSTRNGQPLELLYYAFRSESLRPLMKKAFHSSAGAAHGDTPNASLKKDGHLPIRPSKNTRSHRNVIPSRETSPSQAHWNWLAGMMALAITVSPILLGGCGESPQKSTEQTQVKPAEPAVPADVQAGAERLLGSEVQILVFGDLAKNGKVQFLAANVVPKTPKNNLPGTIVTRAVIAEKNGESWTEVFRCDEHLKNANGFLGMTPIDPVTGWRLQYEQDPEKGLALYLTPVKGLEDRHVLPIGVKWNPATKRYQSLDRSYEHFLPEAPTLTNSRSHLR